MNCDRPDCNGVHSSHFGHSYRDFCEGVKEKMRASMKKYQQTPQGRAVYRGADERRRRAKGVRPLAEYLAGIRTPEERIEAARESDRKMSKTPGTFRYNYAHGIGEAGERKREQDRRLFRTPGTYAYKRDHGEGFPGLTRFISRRTRELSRQREAIAIKLMKADEEIEQLEEQLNGKR